MATNRTNIGSKFQNTDIPSEADFKEIFDSFVHKDEDKADFQMVETGTDTDHYVTPALLRTGLQNIGIITGNSYMPYKEYFEDSFSGTVLPLSKFPIQNSVKVFKNGQLLQEGQQGQNVQEYDYIVNYDTAVITFSDTVSDRNLEVDYWYKNLSPNPGSGSGTAIDFTSFLHTSGNETKNGLLTFNNTTSTSTSGIILNNSGAAAGTTSLDVTNSGAGSGISLQNSSTGTGVKVSNAGAGVAVNVNSASGSTGDILQVSKNNVVTAKIDNEGNVTAEKFVTSGGARSEFVKGDGFLDPTTYADDTTVIHITGNESKDGALNLTHNTAVEDVLTITKNNSANCLRLVQNSSSNATTSTFDTTTADNNRKAISIQKVEQEKAFITHDGNVSGTSFTTLNEKADITDGFLTLGDSTSPVATAGHAKLYAKTDGTTDMYVMGSDGVEKKIGGVVDLSGKENTIAPGTTAQYYRGDKSWQTLDKTAVGLTNVENTSDLSKPVSTATQTELNKKLNKTGPDTFTGTLTIDSGVNGISGFKLAKIPNSLSSTIATVGAVPNISNRAVMVGNDYYVGGYGKTTTKISKGIVSDFGTYVGSEWGLTFATDNNFYFASGSTIYRRNLNGIHSVFANTPADYQRDITQASDGNLYAIGDLGKISKITLLGVVTQNIATILTSGTNARICSDEEGNIYVYQSGTIFKMNCATLAVSTLATQSEAGTDFIYSKVNKCFFIAKSFRFTRVDLNGNITDSYYTGITAPNYAGRNLAERFSDGHLFFTNGDLTSAIATELIPSSPKLLTTDSSGLIVKSTYLEDVQYLKASDVDLSSYAKLDSPGLTGIPTAPTSAVGTNTTQIATTAFVLANSSATSDASLTLKGKLKLAGDLGGTADLPTTPTAVHKTGTETIGGIKTFTSPITVDNGGDGSAFLHNVQLVFEASNGSPAVPAGSVGITATTGGIGGIVLNADPISGSNAVQLNTSLLTSLKTQRYQNANGDIALTINPTSLTATSFIKSGGTSSQYLMADGSVSTSSQTLPYKSYVAMVSQSGTSAPVLNVIYNDLGQTVTSEYQSVGIYRLNVTGLAFTTGKTAIFYSDRHYQSYTSYASIGGSPSYIFLMSGVQNVAGTFTDSAINGSFIEIRVYN